MTQSSNTDLRISTAMSLEICPIRLTNSTGKSYKESITKEIIIIVNALLNSGGGTLEMVYKSTTPLRKQIDDSVRIIEQKIGDLIGTVGLVSNIKFQVLPAKIFLNVKKVEGPFVVNYNLYLPTKSQVKVIQPFEPVAKVKSVINRLDKPIKERYTLTPGAYYQEFVLNERVTCDEGTEIQWKSLKSESSKNVSLADRITGKSNKLPCYISAFANHSGGHIYYGINDDGIVEGEIVTDKKIQTEITRKVAQTFEKMIWPRYCNKEQLKGKYWDIFFVPVKDSKKHPIASVFVIVVAIARCRGGVFTDKPESYHIVDGKVERINLVDVQNYFHDTSGAQSEPIPSEMQRVPWSSKKNRHIYQVLTTKLVQFRNDKKSEEFKKLCQLAVSKYPKSCARLVCIAEEAAIACKNNEFKTAKLLLSNFQETVNESMVNDVCFFELRGLCLMSRIERAEGKFEESYNTVKVGLQKMQLVPADFLTTWFYIHAAAVANILASKEEDLEKYNILVEESQMYLQAALRDANTLDDNQFPRSTSDLKQKARIYLAMSNLGCSLTAGEIAEQKQLTEADIVDAASELKAVRGSMLDGIQPTSFQEVEYFLAESDLCYCRFRLSSNLADQTTDLKWALDLSKKAKALALELQFQEAVFYAQRRLDRLTKRLKHKSSSKPRFEQDLEDLLDFHNKDESEEN